MRRAVLRLPARSPQTLIAALALVTAAVPVVIYLWLAAHRLDYRYELDWLEGGQVELAGRVLHGQGLYSPPGLAYAGFTYTPLYSFLSAAVAEITGLSFLPLRIVSLVASLVLMSALGLYVRALTRDWIAGAVAVGLFAATYGLTGWFFDIGRSDSTYVALALLTLWLGRGGHSVRAGIGVGALAFLAFFTKQTGLIAVGPALVCAALARPRFGVTALVTLVVLAGASTLILDAATHSWYRFYIEGELAGQPSIAKNVLGFWRKALFKHLHWLTLLAALGVLAALFGLPRRRPGWRELIGHPWLYDLAAAAGLFVAAWVSLVHSGSYLNVLMPAYAAAAGIGGAAFGMLRRRGWIAMALALALVVVQTVNLLQHEHGGRSIPTPTMHRAGDQLISALRKLKGPVLVLRHPWYGTLAGQGVFAQADGITEILRSANPKGRRRLERVLPGSLERDHVQAVVLDAEPPPAWLAPQLEHDFRLVPGHITTTPLRPVSDLASQPTYLYVRRTG